MAYKIESKRAYVETLRITGRRALPLFVHVNVSVDTLTAKAKPAVDAMQRAGKKYTASKDNDVDAFKEFTDSIDSVFKIVFGERKYARVLKYYNGEYIEMLSDLTPFIRDSVTPAIQKALSDERRK